MALACVNDSLVLRQRGHIDVIGCLLGIKILLRNQGVFIQFLRTLVIENLLFQICLGMIDIRLRRLLSGDVGGDVPLRLH